MVQDKAQPQTAAPADPPTRDEAAAVSPDPEWGPVKMKPGAEIWGAADPEEVPDPFDNMPV